MEKIHTLKQKTPKKIRQLMDDLEETRTIVAEMDVDKITLNQFINFFFIRNELSTAFIKLFHV